MVWMSSAIFILAHVFDLSTRPRFAAQPELLYSVNKLWEITLDQ